jgi:hypothetical protein
MSQAQAEAILGKGQKNDSGKPAGTFQLEYPDMTLMFVEAQLVNVIPKPKTR